MRFLLVFKKNCISIQPEEWRTKFDLHIYDFERGWNTLQFHQIQTHRHIKFVEQTIFKCNFMCISFIVQMWVCDLRWTISWFTVRWRLLYFKEDFNIKRQQNCVEGVLRTIQYSQLYLLGAWTIFYNKSLLLFCLVWVTFGLFIKYHFSGINHWTIEKWKESNRILVLLTMKNQ